MRDIIDCIKKYVEITNDENFIRHWKDIATKLSIGIENSYISREEKIVKIIEDIINNIGQFSSRSSNFNISTNSIFIHGNKSQVEFEYYGQKTQRELGDIIFILSVVHNGRKIFEKMTINQLKKSKTTSWYLNNKSSKQQLYLLSRFPTFRGVKRSLIPMKEYNLANISACLGSHGLLYLPGDFALISSKELEVLLSGKSSLNLNNLVERTTSNTTCSCFPCYLLPEYDIDFEECFEDFLYNLHRLLHYCPKYPISLPSVCNLPVLGNSCIAYNVYDFSNKYLLGHIGELIYAKKLPHNRLAFQFLQDLLDAIRRKAKRERSEDVLEFIRSFYHYEYKGSNGDRESSESDYEGGGIGIIHTTVNLGEGEY